MTEKFQLTKLPTKPSLTVAGLIFSLGALGLAGVRGTKGPRFPQALCEMELQKHTGVIIYL